MPTRRVVAIGDLHAGHIAGLTPPAWQCRPARDPGAANLQRELWREYTSLCRRLGPVDVLIANGDLIDGTGHRSGGTEELSTDRLEQVDMAVACIQQWRARKVVCTYGTAYHTGEAEDLEKLVAARVGAEIHSHVWPSVDGVVFDVKHHLGGSSVPHGRHTAIARDRLWNLLWADREDGQPRAQVYLRSHVHYHQYAGGPGWLAMTLPALQAAATRYGARRCSGTVDWGVTWFDCRDGRVEDWGAEIVALRSVKQGVIEL